MPSLVIERGQEKGFSFALRPGVPVVVGRDPSNQVVISDPAASRRHFQIEMKDGVWLISDLGSRNSTYVNEEQLEKEQALAWGDRVQVGETVFSFLEEEQTDKHKTGLAGKDIAGYKILERVGRGGMGTVYKARQISLNRIVALKVLSSRYASDPSFVEKFVAEARAAAQLNHPNVVQVFDVGTVSGVHFFSMEFMEGGAVQDLLSQSEHSRLHWTEAMPLMMDAARGLVFAERHNIVHRDIKPDNLMLTVENKVKIGDLGLAARSDEAGDGKIFGTPHFIAPEQARGKDVGHAADIYSLGASFYRMVAGRTPFSGSTVKEILRAQVNEPHVPLVQEIEDFPPDLSAIVDKMMAKSVEERYRSATDLLRDLEAFQIEHQIELAGGRKINKGVLALGAIVILGLAGVVAWQLSKDPERTTETIYVKENTGPAQPIGPVLTAEKIREQKEMAAKNALLEAKLKEPGPEITLDAKDAWLDQAKSYEDLAVKPEHKGTPAAKEATDRAKEIRDGITQLEQEYAATVGRAKTWWERQEARIDEMLTDGDWTGVLREAKEIPESKEAKEHLPHVPEAATYLAGLESQVLTITRKSLDEALLAAQSLLDGGQPSEALSNVSTWEREMRPHAAAHEELQKLADSARDWVSEREETLRAELDELLVQDRMTYATVVRAVRRLGDDVEPPSVFDFQFGKCRDAVAARAGELRTWVYQDRLEQRTARLAMADQAWGGFVAALDAGELVKPDETLIGFELPAGSRASLSSSKPVDRNGFMLDVAIGPAKAGRPYEWANLRPSHIWQVFLRDRLDRVPGDLALGLACAFVEVANPSAARQLLERATAAGAQIDPTVRVVLEQEITALAEYEELRDAKELTPSQRMARVKVWRERNATTEAFLLLDGRPASALPPLIPEGARERFIATWGVRPDR